MQQQKSVERIASLLCVATLMLTMNGGVQAQDSKAAEINKPFLNGALELDDEGKIAGGKLITWVEFASDYVFRGESETNDGQIPSLKGQVTWKHDSGFYVGVYMANNLFPGGDESTDFTNPKINAIWGPSAGYAISDIGGSGLNYNGFLFQYIYPGDNASNYLEMFNYLDKQFGNTNLMLELSPTLNEWFGIEGLLSYNIAGHAAYTFPHDFTLSATLGYQGFDYSGDQGYEDVATLDWTHWNIGIYKPVWGLGLDLRYHDTDIDGYHEFYGTNTPYNNIVDARVVVAVSKTF